jgi:hypothetical protein
MAKRQQTEWSQSHDIDASCTRGAPTGNGDAGVACTVSIDDLIDQAVAAINRGVGSLGRR